jgi:thioredoxin-like negative regulator of GroEL
MPHPTNLRRISVFAVLLLGAVLCSAESLKPQINLDALAQPLQQLTPQDRKTVDQALNLIDQSQHAEALATLTRLTKANGKNSALRILHAYVLLELGNATGALKDAKVAESAGTHTAYKCWFLAQVAYLTGDKPLCHREIDHIGADPTYGPQAQNLGRSLDTQAK